MQQWIKIEEVKIGDKVINFRCSDGRVIRAEDNLVNKVVANVYHPPEFPGCVWLSDKLEGRGGICANNDFTHVMVERAEETAGEVWVRLKAPDYQPPEKVVTRHITTADGLKGSQCLERYLDNMREAVWPDGDPRAGQPKRWDLSKAQKTLAQLMWSAELKQKATEQKVKDTATAISVVTEWDE